MSLLILDIYLSIGALETPHWGVTAPKGTALRTLHWPPSALGNNALVTTRTPGPAPRVCGNDGREKGRHPKSTFTKFIHSTFFGELYCEAFALKLSLDDIEVVGSKFNVVATSESCVVVGRSCFKNINWWLLIMVAADRCCIFTVGVPVSSVIRVVPFASSL